MKTALITGASRGIGRETARAFAQDGYALILQYHTQEEKALSLREELLKMECPCLCVRADISREEEVEALFAAAEAEFSHIDVLVNNAGIAQQKLFTDLTLQDWERLFAVDVTGVFLCCRRALPGMIRRQQGVILNISSMWGQVGASCEVHYSAAKAAVIGLTKALAKEEGPSRIRVNCIAPGVIATEMNAHLTPEDMEGLREETPLLRIGTPADVARAAVFLASDQASFITGQVLGVNGGMVI
ncbi:MAG: SDR family oxidoreductase [Clostridia bacterium]|nr:SDR family oxidoreductase [Clostridia bacterium]